MPMHPSSYEFSPALNPCKAPSLQGSCSVAWHVTRAHTACCPASHVMHVVPGSHFPHESSLQALNPQGISDCRQLPPLTCYRVTPTPQGIVMLTVSSMVPDSDEDAETANPLQFGLLFASLSVISLGVCAWVAAPWCVPCVLGVLVPWPWSVRLRGWKV